VTRPLLALCLLAGLAACLPVLSGGFGSAAGGPARTALATVPTVEVPNPFVCPGPAPSPAPPAPRGEGRLP
jgi:hypothetical protein